MNRWSGYEIVWGTIHGSRLSALLDVPEIRWVFPTRGQPETEDEMAALEIIASVPSGANHPDYSDLYGAIRTSAIHPVIGCIDTGFDNGELLRTHRDVQDRLIGILEYSGAPAFDSSGHGTHIGGILIGNGASGATDNEGYRLGMGLIPDGFLLMSNAIRANPFPPSGGFSRMAYDLAQNGIRICNNSWNDREGIGIGYTANCAVWDQVVRNAAQTFNPEENLPFLPVFSCGNNGPEPSTITSPKEAKNIITVGAIGSDRSNEPGLPWGNSSRGPCLDGRIAPLLAAPGTDIYSCAPNEWHSLQHGTSMAAAHVSGAAAIIEQRVADYLHQNPSPAAIRAILVGLSRPGSIEIPDTTIGFGILSIEDLSKFDPQLSLIDQEYYFDSTGDVFHFNLVVIDPSKPVRMVLAWTDPPAAPEASPAIINDLTLTAMSGQDSFCGNAFSGRFSRINGPRDHLNTIEMISLNTSESVIKGTITADSLRGDGIPDNELPVDQDFVLVAFNGILVDDKPRTTIQALNLNCYDSVRLFYRSLACEGEGTATGRVGVAGRDTYVDRLLDEVEPQSGLFIGRLFTAPEEIHPDSIQTHDGDRLQLEVTCGQLLSCSSFVDVDCAPPVALGVTLTNITDHSISIRFNTSEDVRTSAHFRKRGSQQWISIRDVKYLRNHSICLSGLDACTEYEAWIEMTDISGNRNRIASAIHPMVGMTDRLELVYEAMMESDPEWPVMEGLWAYGQPQGIGSPPDPSSGSTGLNVIGYNLEGNYENVLSPSHAVSPMIDCSDSGDYTLLMDYWLCTENYILDKATISMMNSNESWKQVWANPLVALNGGFWSTMELDVTEIISRAPRTAIRITQGQTDPIRSMCGWNIDDLRLQRSVPCAESTPNPFPDTPHVKILLECNATHFVPGDRMRIEAFISDLAVLDPIGIAAVILMNDTYYYYPDWTPEPDWETILLDPPDPINWAGTDRRILLDLVWPQNYRDPLELRVIGILFNVVTSDLLDIDEINLIRFDPARSLIE